MAVLLLLWTAADLTDASLCALEQEQSSPAAASDRTGATIASARSTAPAPEAPDAVHVDDCFCCSHCVELVRLWPAITSEPASHELAPLVLPAPRLFGLRLYHPPLV